MLCASDIVFTPTLDPLTNQPNENEGNLYAKFNSSDRSFSISEENSLGKTQIPQKSTITFKTYEKTSADKWSAYAWYDGITGLTHDNNLDSDVSVISINTPTSTIVLDSFMTTRHNRPDWSLGGDTGKAVKFTNIQGDLNIVAKTLQIGGGHNLRYAFENERPGEEIRGEASLAIFQGNNYGKADIQTDILVKSDGFLQIDNLLETEFSFTLRGGLSIDGGKLVVGSRTDAQTNFVVTKEALIKDAYIAVFVSGQNNIKEHKILTALGGVALEGQQEIVGFTSYFLRDFVDVSEGNNKSPSVHQQVSRLYEFTPEVVGNSLFANATLTQYAKNNKIEKIVEEEKNNLALWFYTNAQENGDTEVQNALFTYLQSQGINPDGTSLIAMCSTRASTLSTTGFDNIDSKLSTIKEGVNNALAESIKNSSNNLLAVNFVNTLMQGYNNTPIELINEVKDNITSLSHSLSLLRNDLPTALALSSRFASFSFAPKKSSNSQDNHQTPNSPNPSNSLSLKDTQVSLSKESAVSIPDTSLALSNSLWANAFGGANLLGSNIGASYGFNLGYDKALGNTLLGVYLSYAYDTLSPLSTLSLNSHNLKLGVYSRIEKESNEIDLELNSLLSIISEESDTQALSSKSSANFLSSLSELKATYGYAFLEGEFRVKPLLGISLSLSYTPSFRESGDIQKDFGSQTNFSTALEVGVEFRKTFANQGFLYSLLSIEQDLFHSQKSLEIDSQSLSLSPSLKTYAQILLGGEVAISKDWSIDLNLGVKQGILGERDNQDKQINETYVSGSVGVGYRF
ncbi:autotransporter outer membrane beta-barrel domain-containing protein [Helicobacter brantae]|uniref:autotransporter outer membrane beta-barrel domain-containing protein n=1 Tax=Helicobacter brantae TaxID=375927 RepID=UPI0011C01974|nr:autotransporter outer membrane beta-barrel domain-containing protein [Helicobacter brantae]